MKHITPDYLQAFFCRGSQCPAPCAAPVDMTWTRTLGDLCETGISMGCPLGAERILLHPEKARFREERDAEPPMPLANLTPDQLALMLDARTTMDIILQNRSLPFRTDVVLALSYGAAFEPMIRTDARYAYEELDWGYTEQPYRQAQALIQQRGGWESRLSDLRNILAELSELLRQDTVLHAHLLGALKLLEQLGGMEYRILRDRFDEAMKPREYLFEQLMVYLVHRHLLAHTRQQTVLPCLKLMAVSFAAIRAMSLRLWQETGALTDAVFTDICRHYARCVEDTPELHRALLSAFEASPLYSMERLLHLLWD